MSCEEPFGVLPLEFLWCVPPLPLVLPPLLLAFAAAAAAAAAGGCWWLLLLLLAGTAGTSATHQALPQCCRRRHWRCVSFCMLQRQLLSHSSPTCLITLSFAGCSDTIEQNVTELQAMHIAASKANGRGSSLLTAGGVVGAALQEGGQQQQQQQQGPQRQSGGRAEARQHKG